MHIGLTFIVLCFRSGLAPCNPTATNAQSCWTVRSRMLATFDPKHFNGTIVRARVFGTIQDEFHNGTAVQRAIPNSVEVELAVPQPPKHPGHPRDLVETPIMIVLMIVILLVVLGMATFNVYRVYQKLHQRRMLLVDRDPKAGGDMDEEDPYLEPHSWHDSNATAFSHLTEHRAEVGFLALLFGQGKKKKNETKAADVILEEQTNDGSSDDGQRSNDFDPRQIGMEFVDDSDDYNTSESDLSSDDDDDETEELLQRRRILGRGKAGEAPEVKPNDNNNNNNNNMDDVFPSTTTTLNDVARMALAVHAATEGNWDGAQSTAVRSETKDLKRITAREAVDPKDRQDGKGINAQLANAQEQDMVGNHHEEEEEEDLHHEDASKMSEHQHGDEVSQVSEISESLSVNIETVCSSVSSHDTTWDSVHTRKVNNTTTFLRDHADKKDGMDFDSVHTRKANNTTTFKASHGSNNNNNNKGRKQDATNAKGKPFRKGFDKPMGTALPTLHERQTSREDERAQSPTVPLTNEAADEQLQDEPQAFHGEGEETTTQETSPAALTHEEANISEYVQMKIYEGGRHLENAGDSPEAQPLVNVASDPPTREDEADDNHSYDSQASQPSRFSDESYGVHEEDSQSRRSSGSEFRGSEGSDNKASSFQDDDVESAHEVSSERSRSFSIGSDISDRSFRRSRGYDDWSTHSNETTDGEENEQGSRQTASDTSHHGSRPVFGDGESSSSSPATQQQQYMSPTLSNLGAHASRGHPPQKRRLSEGRPPRGLGSRSGSNNSVVSQSAKSDSVAVQSLSSLRRGRTMARSTPPGRASSVSSNIGNRSRRRKAYWRQTDVHPAAVMRGTDRETQHEGWGRDFCHDDLGTRLHDDQRWG